ncbi:hypothetical protein DPX16_11786 [Anabarilius grahami]|uniref:Uncharacterized protein n=1 Tax=Anabarilius grahami TaxID=495550 RepID=A0A3N0Z8G4_ANAGA|nr:hypothetical protein DPX16_11786 [Anabarilius grahami]
MCENKALNAAERGGCQMPLRPDSEPLSSPSGLTPSGLDLRHAAGPLIYLVQASRGKRVCIQQSKATWSERALPETRTEIRCEMRGLSACVRELTGF